MRPPTPALTGTGVDSGRVVRTVTTRLLPLLLALYVANFIDRVNISVAALRMNADLGLSHAAYGLAAGIFFTGYLLCQVPASIVLHRLGARRWIAAMAIGWGICSAATGLVTTPGQLYTVRFLLGAVEAGFFPGVIHYLSCWFPGPAKARATAYFLLGVPIANVVGVPLAGLLIEHGGTDTIAGWRTMFWLLALPSVLLGLAALRILPDTPHQAPWLTRAHLADRADRR